MNGNAKRLSDPVDAMTVSQISFAQRSKRKTDHRPIAEKCKCIVADALSVTERAWTD